MLVWETYGMPHDLHPIEENILQFVKDNPGKSKSDVVRFLKDRHIAARIATLTHIDKLESEKMIRCELENPNSQIYKIYINENNKLASVLGELEEFKEAYIKLLEKSEEKISEMASQAKHPMTTRAKERYPAILPELAKVTLDKFEKEIRMKEVRKEADRIIRRISDLKSNDKEKILAEIKKLDFTKIDSFFASYQDLMKRFEEDIDFPIRIPISLFYVLVDLVFYRSILKWPEQIEDKEVLSQMYSVVYNKIAEIQFELSRFIKSIKVVPLDPVSMILHGRSSFLNPGLKVFADIYHILEMDSEMKQVMNSILRLNEDIKELNLFGLHIVYLPIHLFADRDKIVDMFVEYTQA